MNTFEKIGNLDLRTLADDEIKVLVQELGKELENRDKKRDWEDWNKAVNAMTAYIEKHGYFIVNLNEGEREIWIESDSIFTEHPGVILAYD